MKRILCVLLTLATLCLCTGCTQSAQETVFAMDTVMDLQLWGQDAQKGLEAVKQIISTQEERWSVTDPTSLIHQGADPAHALFNRAEALSQRTGGAFDPRLGAVVASWGFYTKQYRIPDSQELREAMTRQDWDLGALVKGYTGQLCVDALESLAVDRAILNLGGNIQTYGSKPDGTPWRIGIQDPEGGDYIGTVSVEGTMAVVTSGDYQRYFEEDGIRYHHILDPQTGMPAQSGLCSVTVICKDGTTADALSTALFVMGLTKGAELWRQSDDFEAVFITREGKIYATEGAALTGCKFEVIRREN